MNNPVTDCRGEAFDDKLSGFVIDMLAEIPSFDQAEQIAIPKLQAMGYDYIWRGDRPPGHMKFNA